MTSQTPVSDTSLRERTKFSVVAGGPLFRLLRRARLTDDELNLLPRRVVVIASICWLPLLLLSAMQGNLWGGGAAMPFLLDIEVHAKFLIAIFLLISAELVAHRRMLLVAEQFRERHLIPEGAMTRFDAAVASAFRLRNSASAEVVLMLFVYFVGILIIWRQYVALDAHTWYATSSADGSKLSLAGLWYGYVSLPIFQFLLLRWYFRLFIWARFIWQVSRIELRLVPTHPDRVGGLGFLSSTVYALIPLAMAHGVVLAGQLANRIVYLREALPSFYLEILGFVILLLCVLLAPLMMFAPALLRARLTGGREYGTFAQRYVREFDAKWLRGGAAADEPLMGSADIQSLADLGNSFEVVRTMRLAIFTKEGVLQLAAATLLPMVPLALTMMPLEDVLKKLVLMLF